ncbi:hypothetical protein BDK51DRAFT_49381 [Blyttiomyces helicus]|uniref:Uncharacterized protein n=1 Tax=Blyttiomyces helicus TaxID=388810 RepID=A0A4V1ISM9_9FUNG|nr:hypothetical protein BDK51DRAFT_49381 [Blyttiomyces helicus]|eukprot:RKO94117.1 hypothetical protein BDK51DRAFT_49381 [Blyttiomyces helicus]
MRHIQHEAEIVLMVDNLKAELVEVLDVVGVTLDLPFEDSGDFGSSIGDVFAPDLVTTELDFFLAPENYLQIVQGRAAAANDLHRFLETDNYSLDIKGRPVASTPAMPKEDLKKLAIMRPDVLACYRDLVMESGYQGISQTVSKVVAEWYWPGMYKEIGAYKLSSPRVNITAVHPVFYVNILKLYLVPSISAHHKDTSHLLPEPVPILGKDKQYVERVVDHRNKGKP